MKKELFLLAVIPSIVLIVACASTGKSFSKIYPGMTSAEVVKVVGSGPDSVENYDGGYASWYYGEDLCLLIQDDKVVAKDKTKGKSMLSVLGQGGMEKKKEASCVPPGYAKKKTEHTITTPFGSVSK